MAGSCERAAETVGPRDRFGIIDRAHKAAARLSGGLQSVRIVMVTVIIAAVALLVGELLDQYGRRRIRGATS